ncbi:hypothetical protein MATL_G00175360 [Megalops atlanticus]|uniref:Ig-like domain-containing protein n=1 Tax=Megalops atlanticus TaxID=7932 RepID=A0A9D3PPJ9_MEGAT|nr:hypothetical protein MATL_G00175360 [Megalops atlanticus]
MIWRYVFIAFLYRELVAENHVSQPHLLVTAQLGDNVTLECFKPSSFEYLFWFKKTKEKPPLCMRTESYPSKENLHGRFQNNPRFHWTFSEQSFNLSISSIEPSDVATYFCASYHWDLITFGNGTSLTLKGVEDPPDSTEHSGAEHETNNPLVPTVFGLGAALAVCVIVIVALICTRNKKTRCEHCKRNNMNHTVCSGDMSSITNCDAEMLNYAALSFSDKKRKNHRKKREMERETVYSDVRSQTWD